MLSLTGEFVETPTSTPRHSNVTLDDLETSALLRDFIENFITHASKLIQPSTGTRESGHLWCG